MKASKLLIYFVGDINQPLHTLGELHGHNDLLFCHFSTPARNDCVRTNLHAVWDTGLIRSIFYDWGAYAEFLDAMWIPQQDAISLGAGTPVDWALEAHKLARDITLEN